jgi:succinyl-diaminopimelate desuccinylase
VTGGDVTIDKARVLAEVDARAGEFVELCSRIIQIPSENPPGDTTELARFISRYLTERGVEHQVLEPRPGNPLIVASAGAARGPHLVLNGHLDVFPADDPSLWRTPPFSGLVEDGRLKGRGAADMKGGMTASLVVFLLLQPLAAQFNGRLSLTLVSDEETGGAWGAAWLLDQHPEYIGDALLNAEPTGLDTVWIGEKGISWLKLVSEGKAGHGSLGRGENAITRLAEAILVARTITDLEGEAPHDIVPILERQARRAIFDDATALGDLLTHCSVNVGMLQGGIKTNVVPRYAEAEVDIRTPLGVRPEDVRAEVTRRIQAAGITGVSVEPIAQQSCPASVIAPSDPLLRALQANARAIVGLEPQPALCPGATDGRFWRSRGVSTVIYGPASHGMAEPDEYIEISDYLHTIRVHAATAIDYLNRESWADGPSMPSGCNDRRTKRG